jgi:type III secretion system chaperone SycN
MDDWIADTVQAFGERMGIEDLALDEDQGLELEMDAGECMGMQLLPDMPGYEMLVYWGKPLLFDPAAQLERALRLVDGRQALPWPAQAAVRKDMLIMTMRIPARSFELPTLEDAVRQLEAMQADAAG